MSKFRVINKNQPSSHCMAIADAIILNLSTIEEYVKDKHAKEAIQSIKRGTFFPENNHVALRMDSLHEDYQIGMVSVMGTTATISRRVIASFHYSNSHVISEMIFVCQSQENTWHREYNNKKKKGQENSNGNRASTIGLLSLLDEIKDSFSIPYIIIDVVDEEAESEFKKYFGK